MRHYIRVYSCIGASHGRWVNNQHLHGYIIYTTSARVAQGVLYNSFRSFSPYPPFFFSSPSWRLPWRCYKYVDTDIGPDLQTRFFIYLPFFLPPVVSFHFPTPGSTPSFMMESVFFYFIFIIIIFCCCTHSKESFPLGTTIRGFYLGFYFSIR